MKKIILIFCLLSFTLIISSQNLVPNGDFEFYSSCPTESNQLNLAVPWYDPTGASPDYYNACAPVSSLVNVPNQTIGLWQYAHSGNAYAGLYIMADSGSNFREYIQVPLSDSLIEGKCYSVTFYTSFQNRLEKAANNIGAYISKTAVTVIPPIYILNYAPQILLPGNPIITDTVNWIKISGLYTAEGGEKYITIGNFQNDSSTRTQVVDTAGFGIIYYYIDDVSLIACEDTNMAVIEYQDPFRIKLFPNPNDGNMVLSYTLPPTDKSALEIYDVTGREIKGYRLNSNTDKLEIKGLHLKEGIYFYSVIVDGKRVNSNKLVIMNDR